MLLVLGAYSFPHWKVRKEIYLYTEQHTQASNISDLFKSPSKWHISHSAASCFQKSNKIIIEFLHSVIFYFLFLLCSNPSTFDYENRKFNVT